MQGLNSRLPGSSIPSQTGRAEQYQGRADAARSHHRLHRPSRRHLHPYKKNSISSGTISNYINPPAYLVRGPATHTSGYQSRQIHDYATGAARKLIMSETERAKLRKERTFIGSTCAACELSLEYKSSGEKVLQFECGHVAHEACLYEYIKGEDEETFCPECEVPLSLDSSRGGNILDLNKLTTMVRSISQAPAEMSSPSAPNPVKVRDGNVAVNSKANNYSSYFSPYESPVDDKAGSKTENLASDRVVPGHQSDKDTHSKHIGDGTSSYQSESSSTDGRPHDYDLAAMETKLKHVVATKGIPRPKVTIRSEFPTMTRSSQQQSLTCLVTVEVPANRTPTRQNRDRHPLSMPTLSTETPRTLSAMADDLKTRVDNWHGLDVDRFGPLRLHINVKVGRDGTNWQKLDCYLFSELLICVREKKATKPTLPNGKPRFQLKGSILVRKHLTDVQSSPDDLILTMNLSVASLPIFRMKFASREQRDIWRLALLQLEVAALDPHTSRDEQDASCTEEDDWGESKASSGRPLSTGSSSQDDTKTTTTAPTEYGEAVHHSPSGSSIHVPIDIVVVVPISSSMQGLKIKLLKDALRFIIGQLGDHDRMGLVTFGSNTGAIPLSGMATKDWDGWREIYRSIKPAGQKSLRADAVDGASAALDLLSQRKGTNPISSILLISDSPTNETEGIKDVVRRAHELNASIYSFGLGQTHKPDNLIELSSRSHASYVYVRDWMMLRECVAGCLGSLQSTSHMSAKLKLKIPEGSVAKFVKITGALRTSKKSSGKDAEAVLGDLRFGDRRDILVSLSVDPDPSLSEDIPHDHWESVVSGLASIGGSLDDSEQRPQSVEEIPLVQADLSYGDFARDGANAHLSHPSLLTITLLPPNPRAKRTSRGSIIPPIPSHPSIVQRRMEMLTSDMLTRALTLTSKGLNDSAHRLLVETRTILQGLGKGSLPPLPPTASKPTPARSSSAPKAMRVRSCSSPKRMPTSKDGRSIPKDGSSTPKDGRQSPMIPETSSGHDTPQAIERKRYSNQSLPTNLGLGIPTRSAASINSTLLHALEADIEACLENIDRPTVFSHDARKAALQTIGVISSQRGYTFRTETESFWAARVSGVQRMHDITKDWQMVGDDTLTEEI